MATTADTVGNDRHAHAAMREAHDAAYRLPEGFGGFTARVTYIEDARRVEGTLRVSGPRAIELDLPVDEAARGWLTREIGSIAGHRWHLPYDEADGGHTLALSAADDSPLGQFVRVANDRLDSSYRVADGGISQVNRTMGTLRFSIQIQARIMTADGRALPAHFTVFYWNTEDGRLTRSDVYHDEYVAIADVYLPAARRIITADDNGISVREVRFDGHEVLAGSGATDGVQLEHRSSRAE